jgi:hypothetical protein
MEDRRARMDPRMKNLIEVAVDGIHPADSCTS